jgi:serralysin
MTTCTTYFKKGQLPESYTTSTFDDPYNYDLGYFLDLWGLKNVSRKGDSFTATMSNGLKLSLAGSGFKYDDGEFSAGTIKDLRLLTADGKATLVAESGLKLDASDFFAKATVTYSMRTVWNDEGGSEAEYIFDGFAFVDWLRRSDDKLNGSDGAEDLFGAAGNDVIAGRGGDDYLGGGSGKDAIDGGSGFDTLHFGANGSSDSLHGITLDARKHSVTDPWGNKETFAGIEGFQGTAYRDEMVGSGADEIFRGGNGRDTIDGGGGTDEVRYDQDWSPGAKDERGVSVDLERGRATDLSRQKDALANIENVYGSPDDDTIIGNGGDNVLGGGYGGDKLTGGKGRDTFLFDGTSVITGSVDRITDFDPKADTFSLDNDDYFCALATTRAAGDRRLADKAFKVAPIDFLNMDGDTRIVYVKAAGDLYYDRDGSRNSYQPEKFAHLDGAVSLTAADFLVI